MFQWQNLSMAWMGCEFDSRRVHPRIEVLAEHSSAGTATLTRLQYSQRVQWAHSIMVVRVVRVDAVWVRFPMSPVCRNHYKQFFAVMVV